MGDGADRLISASFDIGVHVVDLRTTDEGAPGFVGGARPRLSWRLASRRGDVRQLAYQVEVALDPAFEHDATHSPVIETSSPIAVDWPAAPLVSRAVRFVRVRVWTEGGRSAWSATLRIEATLLSQADWSARPIGPQSNVGRVAPGPAPLVRRAFTIDRPFASARLYATALGVHETWLNGAVVGDALLEPGWSAYQSRLHYAVHDVTAHLKMGENVLAAAIGDGWWRGWLTWMGKRAVYGAASAYLAQLEIKFADGASMTIATDQGWRGSYGAITAADLYDGTDLDLGREPQGWRQSGYDDSHWEPVARLPLPDGLTLRPMPPIRIVDRWSIDPEVDERGLLRIDTGQNLAGFLRLVASGPAGAKITVRHAEVLDDQGRLHTAPLRRAKATDTYILAGAPKTALAPPFTFHGFRYAEIEADAGVEVLSAEVCAISSDLPQIGAFDCSDPRLVKLFNNVRWSQLGNFVGLPTDCPQRDERLGWTGDIQVFAPTACANADARSFLASWLADLSAEQRGDGNVPSTVPNVIGGFEYEWGGVGWGDAATLVPWAVYEASGDRTILAEQFASMRAWVDYGASRRDARGVWTGEFQLGDWLDPGAPPEAPHKATTDSDFIATAYLAHSAEVVSRAAGVLGETQAETAYRALSRNVAAAAWERWRDTAVNTQTGCAMALLFGIAPPEASAALAERLAALIKANGDRIGTGFLGTPLVLPALSEHGQTEAAYRLLLNEQCPGWLYQVARGATTMWERWDAVREDGSLHAGEMDVAEGASMVSFNHYAYGAVAAWLYRTVAGLRPCAEEPGYGSILFAPRPGGGLSHASAAIDTAYGPAGINWRLDGDRLRVELTIPPGARGRFSAPPGWTPVAPLLPRLGSGLHTLVLARPQ